MLRVPCPFYSSRTETLSVAPFESITVRRMKSGAVRHPGGVSPKLVAQHGRAVDEPGERRRAAERLEGKRRCARRLPGKPEIDRAPIGRKGDLECFRGGDAVSLRRQFALRRQDGARAGARPRCCARKSRRAETGSSRPRGQASRRRRTRSAPAAIRPTSPGTAPLSGRPTQTAMVVLRSKPDGPGIAIAVRGAGLEGDAVGGTVERRRSAFENIRDIPGGHRLGEAHGQRPAPRRDAA